MSSNDRERIAPSDSCHILIAIARPKDNEDIGSNKHVIRQLVRDEEKDLADMRVRCNAINPELTYRIYHTVNARNFKKALRLLMHKMVDDIMVEGYRFVFRIDSIWKTCLLQKSARETKNFLFDIDSEDIEVLMSVKLIIQQNGAKILKEIKSPHGYHLVTTPFDYREVKSMNDVTVLTDGYYFVEVVNPRKV